MQILPISNSHKAQILEPNDYWKLTLAISLLFDIELARRKRRREKKGKNGTKARKLFSQINIPF